MADLWELLKNDVKHHPETYNAMSGLLGIMPVAGDIQSGLLAANDFKKGNYGDAFWNGVGLLPFVPSLAGTMKSQGKKLADVIKQTDFEKAHEAARIDAWKNHGLPENNTAMDRARAGGFQDGWFHGTRNEIKGGLKKTGENTGADSAKMAAWLTDSPDTAGTYAGSFGENPALTEGANILPLMVRSNAPGYLYLTKDARGNGFDGPIGDFSDVTEILNDAKHFKYKGVRIKNLDDQMFFSKGLWTEPSTHMGIFNPKNIRSRFAAFNLSKLDSPDLLASVGGLGLAGLLGMYENNKQYD